MARGRGRDVSCDWCGGQLTARSRLGSERYGLVGRGLWSCDACLDARAYERPPAHLREDSAHWSFRHPKRAAEHASPWAAGAFGLFVVLAFLVALGLGLSSIGWRGGMGLLGMFAVGGVVGLRYKLTLLRPADRRLDWRVIAVVLGVTSLLRIVNRAGHQFPVLDVFLACGLSAFAGWMSVVATRTAVALHRRRRLAGAAAHRPTDPGVESQP